MHRAVEGNVFQIDGNRTGASLEDRTIEILAVAHIEVANTGLAQRETVAA